MKHFLAIGLATLGAIGCADKDAEVKTEPSASQTTPPDQPLNQKTIKEDFSDRPAPPGVKTGTP